MSSSSVSHVSDGTDLLLFESIQLSTRVARYPRTCKRRALQVYLYTFCMCSYSDCVLGFACCQNAFDLHPELCRHRRRTAPAAPAPAFLSEKPNNDATVHERAALRFLIPKFPFVPRGRDKVLSTICPIIQLLGGIRQNPHECHTSTTLEIWH